VGRLERGRTGTLVRGSPCSAGNPACKTRQRSVTKGSLFCRGEFSPLAPAHRINKRAGLTIACCLYVKNIYVQVHLQRTAHIFCFRYGGRDPTQAPAINKCVRHLGCSDWLQRNAHRQLCSPWPKHTPLQSRLSVPHQQRRSRPGSSVPGQSVLHPPAPSKPRRARARGVRRGRVQLATQQEARVGGSAARPTAPGEPATRRSCRKKLGKVAECFSSKTPPEEERRLVRNAVPRASQIHWFPTFLFIGNDPFDTFT